MPLFIFNEYINVLHAPFKVYDLFRLAVRFPRSTHVVIIQEILSPRFEAYPVVSSVEFDSAYRHQVFLPSAR